MEVKPGYKQTEVGVIPEDWEPTPLMLLSAFITKGSTPTTYGFGWENDGVLFLRSECVSEQGLDLAQSMFISSEAHNALKRSEIRGGDILITITGNVGRVIHLSKDFGAGNINQHIARIRIADTGIVAAYVFHFLSQTTISKYYNSITTGQAYPQISLKQVRDTRVPLPPTIAEQTAISTALSDVDALIMGLEKLIAKKKAIKQGAMQELLTGKKRLPGFSGEWEVKEIKEIAPLQRGFDLPTKDIVPGEFPVVYSNGVLNTHHSFQVEGPGVVTGRSGTLGAVTYIEENYWPHNTSLWVTDFKGNDAKFIYHLYISLKFERFGTGSGVPTLNRNDIHAYRVSVPGKRPEQSAIAQILSGMDAEIEALEKKLAKYRQIKQGMMQELLTGKIRLV